MRSSASSFSSIDLSHPLVLLIALRQVYQRFDLGLQLGVPYHSLKEIERTQRGMKDSKRETLVAWLQGQGGEPSKQFLVTALRNI